MQKTIAQLQTANAAIFGAGKDTLGDDEKAYNLDLNDSVKPLERVVSASQTAILGESYVVVATSTFTDPAPTEGKGFTVFVRNGTATVGGVAYDQVGTIINRIYHSGSWANYPISLSGSWNPSFTVDGSVISSVASVLQASYSIVGNILSYSILFNEVVSDFSSGTEGFIQIAADQFPIEPTGGHVISGSWYNPVLIGMRAQEGSANLRINLNDPTSTATTNTYLSITGQCQL